MKITLTPRHVRNPLVAHARFRRAGSHQPGGGSLRQESGRSLKRELDQMARLKPPIP